jgi:hypothetical protein
MLRSSGTSDREKCRLVDTVFLAWWVFDGELADRTHKLDLSVAPNTG